jgi:SAM-dependent methyltransferase
MNNLLRRIEFDLLYWFGVTPWDSGVSPPELYDFIASHPAGRAVDIGCGTGTNIVTLANAGWQVTGFDFAPSAVRAAKRKAKNAGIQAEIYLDDATRMKHAAGPFDLALDLGCFHGIANKADYLTQLTRILAPGGFWLLYGFLKGDSPRPGPGLADADLSMIPARGLTLISRKDGWDKKERPSAWFLHQLQ